MYGCNFYDFITLQLVSLLLLHLNMVVSGAALPDDMKETIFIFMSILNIGFFLLMVGKHIAFYETVLWRLKRRLIHECTPTFVLYWDMPLMVCKVMILNKLSCSQTRLDLA